MQVARIKVCPDGECPRLLRLEASDKGDLRQLMFDSLDELGVLSADVPAIVWATLNATARYYVERGMPDKVEEAFGAMLDGYLDA